MSRLQEILGPGWSATLAGLLLAGLYAWERVRLAREQRLLVEREVTVRMLVEMAAEGRQVSVRHCGPGGDWLVECRPNRGGQVPRGHRQVPAAGRPRAVAGRRR